MFTLEAHARSPLTVRISEPAPLVLDLKPKCHRGFHCIRLLAHSDRRFHIQSDRVLNVPPQRNKVDSKIPALHPLLDHIKTSPNLICDESTSQPIGSSVKR